MRSRPALVALAVMILVGAGGCIDPSDGQNSLGLVGIADEGAVLDHYEEWSGWTTLPSTVWQVDTAAGAAEKIGTARPRYDLQAAGDYYVAEYSTDSGSAVMAVQISTGEEITILERDVTLGGRYDRVFVLDGTDAIVLTDDGLLVYDLEERTSRAISLDADLSRVLAAGDGYALVERGYVYSGDNLLVDLATGDAAEVPALPEGREAYFGDAVIADGTLVTSGRRYSGLNEIGLDIFELNIDSGTWSSLVYYAHDSTDGVTFQSGTAKQARLGIAATRLAYVRGASDAHVLVEFVDTWQQTRLDLLDRTTGELTAVAQRTGILTEQYCGLLHDGRVYWIDEAESKLIIHDIASGEEDVVTLNVPPTD